MFVHLADQADAFSLSEGQFYLQVSLEGILGYCIAILQHLVCGRLDGLGNLIGRQNLHIISWEDAQPAMVFPLQPVLVHFLGDCAWKSNLSRAAFLFFSSFLEGLLPLSEALGSRAEEG